MKHKINCIVIALFLILAGITLWAYSFQIACATHIGYRSIDILAWAVAGSAIIPSCALANRNEEERA